MYSITITITCNHKNQQLQITFRLLKTCNRLHVITVTDYNYNRSEIHHPFTASLWLKVEEDLKRQTIIICEALLRISTYVLMEKKGKYWHFSVEKNILSTSQGM